jgi:hypothetical protein
MVFEVPRNAVDQVNVVLNQFSAPFNQLSQCSDLWTFRHQGGEFVAVLEHHVCVDVARVSSFFRVIFHQYQNIFIQHEKGLLDE